MNAWVLALSYWLHMLATIVWVGGLALMALVVWPGARAVLGPGPQLADLLDRLQRRFNPWAWGSLAVLIFTGLTQMAGNENYAGQLPGSAASIRAPVPTGSRYVAYSTRSTEPRLRAMWTWPPLSSMNESPVL